MLQTSIQKCQHFNVKMLLLKCHSLTRNIYILSLQRNSTTIRTLCSAVKHLDLQRFCSSKRFELFLVSQASSTFHFIRPIGQPADAQTVLLIFSLHEFRNTARCRRICIHGCLVPNRINCQRTDSFRPRTTPPGRFIVRSGIRLINETRLTCMRITNANSPMVKETLQISSFN